MLHTQELMLHTIWAILLALFNVIAFVSAAWIEQGEYTASFWIARRNMVIAIIIIAVICAVMAHLTRAKDGVGGGCGHPA